jgi:hypothetical protein
MVYYPVKKPGVTGENVEVLSQDSVYHDKDSNWASPKYKSELLPCDPASLAQY